MSAVIPACCDTEHGHDVFWDCTLAHAVAIWRDAARYPSRNPVIACPFDMPLTVTVRSYIPSSAAKAT